MMHAILFLNYLAVLVLTAVGFLFGWLWPSPLLAEIKITEDMMKEAAQKGRAFYFLWGFLYTLLSTFGLAVLLNAHRSSGWLKGVELGAFVGLVILGARMFNSGVWEIRSARQLAINLGHEIVLVTLQGAILAVWR
jgi:hypothetical protein